MVARIAAVLGGPRRALALAGLTATLAAYTAGRRPPVERRPLAGHPLHLARPHPGDARAIVLLLLPLAFRPGLLPVALALVVVAVGAALADLDVLFNLTKLFALVLLGFWFLSYFENVAWAALVAAIIPWVDIWSVFFGPTGKITSDHPSIFEHISIAFRVPGEAQHREPRAAGHPLLRPVRRGGSAVWAPDRLDLARDDRPDRVHAHPVREGSTAAACRPSPRSPSGSCSRTPISSGTRCGGAGALPSTSTAARVSTTSRRT